MNLFTIDPGLRATGWARFKDEFLVNCGLYQAPKSYTVEECAFLMSVSAGIDVSCLDQIVCEIPQVYQQRLWKGDPNDLVNVAVIVGAICGQFEKVKFVRPHDWKGSVPKKVHNKQILTKLQGDEKYFFDRCKVPASLKHNVLDAIGIGLWYLKRR